MTSDLTISPFGSMSKILTTTPAILVMSSLIVEISLADLDKLLRLLTTLAGTHIVTFASLPVKMHTLRSLVEHRLWILEPLPETNSPYYLF